MAGWHHQLDARELGKLWELVMDREIGRASCRERVNAEGEGDDRGLDSLMASLTQ